MSFITLRALLFVAECLLASILLPLLAYAATRLVHRAALRHLVWLTMFGVLAVLPLAALLLPARQIVLTEPAAMAAPAPMESIIALPLAETMEPLPEAPRERRVAVLDFKVDPTPAPVMAVPAPAPVSAPATVTVEPWLTPENALLLLVLLWAVGLCWNLARMALGAIGLRRIRLQSQIFSVAGAPCEVRLSPQAGGPATLGVFRAMVLLPETARHWSAARLQAVLAHEGAHVRRHDIASQTLARLVCAVFWFNPLLWLAARALRREAEFAADDAVLAGGMTASSYAAELVALASEIVTPVRRLPAPSAGMADSALMTRVQSVLAANASRRGVTGMDVARTLSLGLAATLLLGTARVDLAIAQDKPAGPAPAAQAAPVVKPAPAAPPTRSASPKVDIEVAPRVDVEVEAIKARAEAAAAEARQIDAMAIESARALAAVEQARKAAQAVADMQVQRAMAQTGSSENAIAAARSLAAIEQAEAAARKVASDGVGEAMRQRMAQSEQQAKDAQQRAREAEQRALEAKAQADEAQRRLEREKQSLLAPPSDKAVFAAAREKKITISPVEVNARLHRFAIEGVSNGTTRLRDHIIADMAREKLAELQNAAVPDTASKPHFHISEIFLAMARPEDDARVKAEIEAIEKQIRGGGSFRGLARQHSQSASQSQDGDMGWVHADQLEAALGAVVTTLKVGELSRPVRGRDGWYLLGLQAVAPVLSAGEARQGALDAEQNSLKQKDATFRSRLWEDVVNNQPYGSLGGTADERALFDAARKLPVVMHNLEVDARVYQQLIRSNNLTPSPEALSELKRRTFVDVTREKLALQGGAEIAAQTGAKLSQPKQGDYFGANYYSRSNGVNVGGQVLVPIVSHRDLKERAGLITMIQANLDEAARKIDAALPAASGPPKNLHTTRWLYAGDEVTVAMQIAAPVSGWTETDAKFNTIVDAAMKETSGKIAAAAAKAAGQSRP